MRLKVIVVVAAIVAALAQSACSSDSDGNGNGKASASGEGTSVVFKATDRNREKGPVRASIKGPSTIRAGVVTLTLINAGEYPHDAQILRVTGNHSAKETIANTIGAKPGSPIPDWVTDGAGVGSVEPGERATVTQVLRPGKYYLLDSETGPGTTSGPNANLHAKNGGVAAFEVVGKPRGALPPTDVTITATEYSFTTDGIAPGKNRLTFENAGQQLHHLFALPYRGGATFEDVVTELMGTRDPESGPIPLNRELGQGTVVIDGGQKQIVEMNFKPGKYALVCYITDRRGGPPHLVKGMINEMVVE
jgi:hypothetical protein